MAHPWNTDRPGAPSPQQTSPGMGQLEPPAEGAETDAAIRAAAERPHPEMTGGFPPEARRTGGEVRPPEH